MKPLSSILYSRRNKKKVLVSINAVMLAVAFLYVIYAFIQSIGVMEERNGIFIHDNAATVSSYKEKAIKSSIIKSIKNNKDVDKIIPSQFNYGIKFEIPGASDTSKVYPIKQADTDYFIKKCKIKLISGRLPEDDKYEIALNKDIAKNRKVKIGDKVGDSINKFDTLPGEYTITGIIDSSSLTSIVSANNSIFPDYKNENQSLSSGFFVFPKEGRMSEVNKYIEKFSNNDAEFNTKNTVQKTFDSGMGALRVLDIIAILSIVIMVTIVGSSKYVQYINRKEEFGLLNAVGYNKKNILKRIFKEVCMTNIIGYAAGLILGLITMIYLKVNLWQPAGAQGFLYTKKGLIISLFIPLFTILFSIIPINNLISKLDPIKMIEKN